MYVGQKIFKFAVEQGLHFVKAFLVNGGVGKMFKWHEQILGAELLKLDEFFNGCFEIVGG